MTRERIRQIEAKALRKLRHPSRSKNSRTFWIDSRRPRPAWAAPGAFFAPGRCFCAGRPAAFAALGKNLIRTVRFCLKQGFVTFPERLFMVSSLY